MTIDQALSRLNKSSFRASFDLSDGDRAYIMDKGMDTIRAHCEDFIRAKLAPAYPKNDGHQTPWKGHPVFRAQHACACCCRGCLAKWYHVPQGVPLTNEQVTKIVNLLMAWIECKANLKKTRPT